MQERVTFHKHEVVGATQTYNFMKRLGFTQPESEYVVDLVRWHQFRFYENTSDSTIIKWLQTLGKKNWRHLIQLRLADREGNLKNEGKPVWTKELKQLVADCERLIKDKQVVFEEDMKINKARLVRLGLSKQQIKEAMANMMAIVKAKPERNTKEYLLEYLNKNYLQETK